MAPLVEPSFRNESYCGIEGGGVNEGRRRKSAMKRAVGFSALER
jgi:hypothetical protein